jgi:hypothetical protein
MQNVWQDHFPEPCGGEGRWGTNWPTEVVEIATLCEFDENDRFFTTIYGSHFQNFVTHFTIKRTQRIASKKNT